MAGNMRREEQQYVRNPEIIVEWRDGRLCIVQARTGKRFAVSATVIALLDALTRPHSASALAASLNLSVGDLDRLLAGMTAGGVVDHYDPDGDQPERLGLSTFERMVHTHAAGKDAIASAGPPDDPPSARHQHPEAGSAIALPRRATGESLPLAAVLARRQSLRSYAASPLPIDTLGAFLAEACAVRSLIGSAVKQTTHRSSPSAGARHSLEVYVLASHVSGLAAGAYHYDPFEHALAMLAPWDQRLEQIQDQFVCRPAMLSAAPQAVLYLTSVVRRVAWKYPSRTLSLIYRDAGCLLQTMYLVATDLGLAPCAIAEIDADISPPFLWPYREEMIHVGSFCLGVLDAEVPAKPVGGARRGRKSPIR